MRTSGGSVDWRYFGLRFALPGALVVAADQLTKYWAAGLVAPISLTSFLSLRFSTNTGAAFSMFTQYPQLLMFIAAAFVIGLLFFLPRMKPAILIPIAFIWGGALGNLIDRLLLGAVRDFIAFTFWPSFNIADSAITVGVGWLIFAEWRAKR